MSELELTTPSNIDPFLVDIDPFVVHYLGPSGTFSERAARTVFDSPDRELHTRNDTIFECTEADILPVIDNMLKDQRARGQDPVVAVVPANNTSTSPVSDLIDSLLDVRRTHGRNGHSPDIAPKLYIRGEFWMEVRLMLAGLGSLAMVKTIHSHPKGIEQSRGFLGSQRQILHEETHGSTAEAARHVQALHDKSHAVLCSREAARAHNLPVIKPDVQDADNNRTRFLVIEATEFSPFPPDLELLRKGGRIFEHYERAKIAGVISPTHPARDNGCNAVESLLIEKGLVPYRLGKRGGQVEKAGGDNEYIVEIEGVPQVLWNIFQTGEAYKKLMKFRLMGVYPVAGYMKQ